MFPILRVCYALSHTQQDCVIESGGGLLRTRQQCGCEARNEHADLNPQIRRDWRAAPHPTSRPDSRLSRSLEGSGSHAYSRIPLAGVFLRCSMIVIVAISDEARRKKRTKSGFLTKTHERSSAAAMLLSQILIEQLRKDEASRRPTRLLLTIPTQLGVAYNAHVMEAILTTVAQPSLALNRRYDSLKHMITFEKRLRQASIRK